MRLLRLFACLAILCATNLVAFNSGSVALAATATTSFTADVWADNWFALYVNGVKVAQDPVPITTTKSFNKVSVSFSARYPLTIALMGRDYTENKSGLEYIGTSQQQIGDAGIIAQIHEKSSGKLVAATSSAWKTYVTNRAPLNSECVTSTNPIVDCKSLTKSTPKDWAAATYKTSGWVGATEYSEQAVGVKDGYNEVSWDQRARLIWSGSLTLDNTVLFRTVAKAALANATVFGLKSSSLSSGNRMNSSNTCDGVGVMPDLAWVGTPSGSKSLLLTMDTAPGPARPGETVQTDFNHLVQYNLSPKATSIGTSLNVGTKGKNFKGSLGYTPPCSQGPGEKVYVFHLYALDIELIGSSLTGAQALSQAAGHILGEAKLNAYYSRN
jgi:phosphatidylethanolamine-binding protein (PEBP) family uncharacterized protein